MSRRLQNQFYKRTRKARGTVIPEEQTNVTKQRIEIRFAACLLVPINCIERKSQRKPFSAIGTSPATVFITSARRSENLSPQLDRRHHPINRARQEFYLVKVIASLSLFSVYNGFITHRRAADTTFGSVYVLQIILLFFANRCATSRILRE